VLPITANEYSVGGNTALLDAMGAAIHKTVNALAQTGEAYRPEKVMFVIITDGEENASREYGAEQVKQMIEGQKSGSGWEFIFLGANIDAVKTAGRFGIDQNRAQNFHADQRGVSKSYESMASAVTSMRTSGSVADDWGKATEEDFGERNRGR
jgi:Mg-chelatase subunit ChlD